mgnify:FL=1
MTQYLDPIIVSVAVMDRECLERTRAECLAQVRPLRRQFWWLWFRNRVAYVLVLGFYFLLVGGAIRLWVGDSSDLSGWFLWTAVLISTLVTWFFVSHTPLNNFLNRWHEQEKSAREEINKHLYTLRAIRSRHRQLGKTTVQ